MSELPHGEVTIADLFRVLLGLREEMSVMSTELKLAASQMQGATSDLSDHETRLRVLEAARAKLIGAASLMGVLTGALGGYIASHLH